MRRDFWAQAAGEAQVEDEMRQTYSQAGYLLDPHTAVGVAVGRRELARDPATPMVVLGTAHPAKFPDAVEKATVCARFACPPCGSSSDRTERFTMLPNDQGAVEGFIEQRARAARIGVLA
jgi:threonine synthase